MEVNRPLRYFFPPPPVLRLVAYVGNWRDRLRLAIERSLKKQSAIARDAGVSPETLSRILTGANRQPSFETVVRIARALNENVGWLLDERGFALSASEQQQLRNVVRFLDDTLVATARRREAPEPSAVTAGGPGVEIPRTYAARGARLVYEAAGDSMIGAGIADRDLLYVKPTRNVREASGRVVVCRLGDSEHVRVLDVRSGRIRLLSRSDRDAPLEIDDNTSFELIGIVVGRSGPLG